MQIEVQNLLGDNMGMSFDKCYGCNYSFDVVKDNGLYIYCLITNEEIIINKCPMGD